MKAPVIGLVALVGSACATPLHLRPVPLRGDGRSMSSLFLGGWDGHRLPLFDDTAIEPGVTKAEDVAHELSSLSNTDYAVIYVEAPKLAVDVASAHGMFCDSPVCLIVLDRKGGDSLDNWGTTLAVFELSGPDGKEGKVGKVWMDGRTVREPGPTAWPLMCLSKTDKPHHLHPDGAAIFPARPSPSGDGFALFGASDLPGQYSRNGFSAPAPNTCDQAVVDAARPPPPMMEPPPALLPEVSAPAKGSSSNSSSSESSSKKRHRKKSE